MFGLSDRKYIDYTKCLSRIRLGDKVSFYEGERITAPSPFFTVVGSFTEHGNRSHLLLGSMEEYDYNFSGREKRRPGIKYSYLPEYEKFPYTKWLPLHMYRIARISKA